MTKQARRPLTEAELDRNPQAPVELSRLIATIGKHRMTVDRWYADGPYKNPQMPPRFRLGPRGRIWHVKAGDAKQFLASLGQPSAAADKGSSHE